MFVIREEVEETIEWPVVVEVAVSGGKSKKYEFTGIFKRLNDEQKKALSEIDRTGDDAEWTESYLNRTMEIMVDWKGVVDKNKEPIPYNRDNLRKAILAVNGMATITGITRAMGQIEGGIKAKN